MLSSYKDLMYFDITLFPPPPPTCTP
jgi:hypothetical protein